MTEAAMAAATGTVPPPAEPDGAPRVAVLDILRGLAILGILFMNINDMGGSLHVLFTGDIRHFGWTTADQIAWWPREVLANGTARALLEMLFGVGMVILTDRAATRATKWQVMRAYWWRNIVLLAFGIIHILVLLWPGDILHTYAIAALLAVLFRRWRPRWLIVAGLSLAMLQLVGAGIGTVMSQRQAAAVAALRADQTAGKPLAAESRKTLAAADKRAAERAKRKAESAALIAAEDAARTGTARTWVQAAWDITWWVQSRGLEILFVWEALATMLIGAALYKLGIIQGARSRRFYQNLTAISYAVGISLRMLQAAADTRFDGQQSIWIAGGEIARLANTVGHIGLVNLLLLSVRGTTLLRPFAAAGRTALSVYILQTLICLWVIYPPWGLALYGQQGWAAFMATALIVNAGLLWLANWWDKRYAIAPVEWAWRSVVAGKRLPFRRVGAQPGAGTLAVA
jgi:uncharacterized protein